MFKKLVVVVPSSMPIRRLLRDSGKRSASIVRSTFQKSVPINRYYSSLSSNQDEKTDKSVLEVEKKLFAIKRKMVSSYTSGNDYPGALAYAIDLAEKVEKSKEMGGKVTTVYASCLNNIALMVGACCLYNAQCCVLI